MSNCLCQRLPRLLQQPAHQLHQGMEQRTQAITSAAARYLGVLRRRPKHDPESEALAQALRQRLDQLHRVASGYLPELMLPERTAPRPASQGHRVAPVSSQDTHQTAATTTRHPIQRNPHHEQPGSPGHPHQPS